MLTKKDSAFNNLNALFFIFIIVIFEIELFFGNVLTLTPGTWVIGNQKSKKASNNHAFNNFTGCDVSHLFIFGKIKIKKPGYCTQGNVNNCFFSVLRPKCSF